MLLVEGDQEWPPIGDLLHFDEFERKLRELIAWSQKRFGDPRDTDLPQQLLLRKALREYNTQDAFDPEHGKKGGVTSIDAEIERYRKYAGPPDLPF